MAERLSTTRYVKPGTYIGELIQPRPGNLTADARVCNYIGRGSDRAIARNVGIRRSFIFEETMNFPNSAPFIHQLQHPSDGVKEDPIRVYDQITGVELEPSQWNFVKVAGEYTQVIISPESFDQNAEYKIDYQSTSRSVKDPLPVQDLRRVVNVGLTQDRNQFNDFRDFFIPYSFSGPVADSGNQFTQSRILGVISDSGNGSPAANIVETAGAYNHNYNRFYELEVVNVTGSAGNYEATFAWKADRYSAGSDSSYPVPLNSAGTRPQFTVEQADPSTQVQDLEFGLQMNFSFDGGQFVIGDTWYFNAVGPGLIEYDSRYFNENQYPEVSDITTVELASGSTGELLKDTSTAYNGSYNLKYRFEVISSSGSAPNRSVTMIYAVYGDIIGPTGQFTVNEGDTQSLPYGIVVSPDFGASNFAAGDIFELDAKAPREFYQAKDDRSVKLTVSNVNFPGADESIITGSFSTGTKEGGFGQFTAEMNLLQGSNQEIGRFTVRDNLTFYFRNMVQGNTSGSSAISGDLFTATVISDETIDWSLVSRVEETRENTALRTDVTGAVTGTAGSNYVVLSNVYEPSSVSADVNGNPISFFAIPGTSFLGIIGSPSDTITISYEYRGLEPAPGALYFMTAEVLRPDEFYNSPQLLLGKAEGREFLAPSTINNHLYIMNNLAFDNGAPAVYMTQPQDADGDGIITSTDIRTSLDAHEGLSRATDLCLLSFYESLSDALAVNETANDPFEKREQMLYVGAPTGTPIGDIDTPDSLIFLARNTLQVGPRSPAQGTRVLLAPTECSVSVQLENGVTAIAELDGSFVAGATAALVNSFSDPSETILRKNLAGFDSMQTYSEPQEELLGQASVTFLSDQGNSVFRFEEDITVHTNSEEVQLISATIQKQFVTKVVRREMDSALISIVPPSPEAGVQAVKATLGDILLGLLGRGLIASYQNEDQTNRDFDPDRDIVVYRDENSLTLYYFSYAFFIKAPIKRLFGLYALNTANLSDVV